ncbi:MAG: family intrarane metalloprotease [Nocardioides sp.]|jgi:membrane protease YdiL (CAAX protease family)|uniref:CPBP family intramembrane glutamic endopeptidase n=1 Tax=Nocardioides sp. TaxID=35761 RepID=UPI00260E0223|nr:CPBP family intramembrane glutamic endopeptidase [Nocardioides sp.]MCW2834956.1 family intrarane metalloprotease [Nocardioides sp.]
MRGWVRETVHDALWNVVPRDQRDTRAGLRRRQVVTVAVVLVGAAVLGYSLRIDPGNPDFYVATLALPAVWVVGAFASGRLHLGRLISGSRPVLQPILLGLALSAVFILGALVVREIEPLAVYVRSVLEYADQGSMALLLLVSMVNGIAEELFFRGAAYAAIPKHPVLWTTVAYVVATMATGNVMLSFAAILLGTVCGLQRRASGGVLAPILTHVTWSTAMLFALPQLFG